MRLVTKGSCLLLFLLLALFTPSNTYSQSSNLPLFQISDLQYAGAFRLPAQEFGSSDLNYSQGPIAYNSDSNSIYIVGNTHGQAIGEFSIPPLVISDDLNQLNISNNRQAFVTYLDQAPDGNPDHLDRIGGITYFDGQLIVNSYEHKDEAADNTLTTLLIADALDLSTSPVDGFYSFQGGTGHTSGWVSPIPVEWQSLLGGTHITGQSSGIPVISRSSVGPSAFVFDATDIISGHQNIPTTRLLDFSEYNPLQDDLENKDGTNDMWTYLSRVTFGMIVPGTRTYFTVGYSGGHRSGICFGCTQNNGNKCDGYCPTDPNDRNQYYWLWDMNDLLAVKDGEKQPYEVRPYNYGVFHTPFENSVQQIGGGAYNVENNILYLSVQGADGTQGIYSNPPVIIAYKLNSITTRMDDLFGLEVHVYPNPFKDGVKIEMESPITGEVRAFIYDMMGRKIAHVFEGTLRAHESRYIFWKPMRQSSGRYQLVIETNTAHKTFQLLYSAD